MKKVVCLLLVIMIASSFALAESVDLSSFTFDELAQLQKAIIQEMQNRDEFKSVWVPQGIYIVGEDIPAGIYTFSSEKIANIAIYKGDPAASGRIIASYSVNGDNKKVAKYELREGEYVEINVNSVLFETYTGLGF